MPRILIDEYGFTTRLNWKIVESLKIQLLSVVHPDPFDLFTLGFAGFLPVDGVEVAAGGVIFDGRKATVFGGLKDNSIFFFEVTGSF